MWPSVGLCLLSFLAGKLVAEGFSVTPLSGQRVGRRTMTMTAAGLPPGGRSINPDENSSSSSNNNKNNKNNMDGPFSKQPVPAIPDKVGAAAIQERIDAARRTRGALARETTRSSGATGKCVRWMPTKASRHGTAAAPSTLPRAMWVLIFNQGSQPASTLGAQRGLYCLWSDGLNSAVAFQERDGALRYAFKLRATGLGIPAPTRVAMTDLQRFCEDHSLGIWLVPSNVVPEAPQKTKGGLMGPRAPPSPPASSASWPPPAKGEGGERSVLTPEDVRRWRADFERLYSQEE